MLTGRMGHLLGIPACLATAGLAALGVSPALSEDSTPATGVVTADTGGSGARDATTREAVRRIVSAPLEPAERWTRFRERLANLRALGPSAVGVVRESVPTLDPVPLATAAAMLAEAGDRPAGAALAARFATLPVGLDETLQLGWDAGPREAILRALSRVGDDAQVPLLAATMADLKVGSGERRLACLALVGIDTPGALRVVDEWLRERSVASVAPWWRPPSPAEFLPLVGRVFSQEERYAAFERSDWALLRKMDAAEGATFAADETGARFVLFREPRLGGESNLWLAPLDHKGAAAGSAQFCGVSMHTRGRLVPEDVRIRATISRGFLRVTRLGRRGFTKTVALASLTVDGDRDGLTDEVERWIGTDPERADTDGDGLADGSDPAPNARPPAPLTEEDAIATAIFEGFFSFEDRTADQLAITSRPLEWRGRRGPTVWLDRAAGEAFFERAGYNGIAHVSITPCAGRKCHGVSEYELGPDERLYGLVLYRGGLNAIGYGVVVRKSGGCWRLRDLRAEWVS